MSIDKAAVVAGIGMEGVRHVAADEQYRMIPGALQQAIDEDRREGWQPFCVVGTMGTTSSTSIEPAEPIAEICEREKLWFHVDAAYGAAAALAPEYRHLFDGWERADSIVFNPHKWMFTPFDCSLLLTRRMDTLRDALSLVPEYLRAYDGKDTGRDYSEYVPQLGRKARGIKMWMQLRYFGLSGLRARLQLHVDLARELAGWIDGDPDAELLYPVPFGTVCFRMRPRRYAGREGEPIVAEALDAFNEAIMNRLNDSGQIFLSHTRVAGIFVLRLVVGNIRTERRHIERAWRLVRTTADELDGGRT